MSRTGNPQRQTVEWGCLGLGDGLGGAVTAKEMGVMGAGQEDHCLNLDILKLK